MKGYNQLYRQWTDKESCFNMCLRTTIRNGAQFDCRSFEHWHRDCPEQAISLAQVNESSTLDQLTLQSVTPSTTKTCATFSMENDEEDNLGGAMARRSRRGRSGGEKSRLDFCVLSNQTMKSAGKLFAPNNKVTYYELLCKRRNIL